MAHLLNVNNVFKDEIPQSAPELFHYTEGESFIRIAKHKTIWMPNINYQNDYEEYYYIFKRTQDVIRDRYPGLNLDSKIFPIRTASATFSFSLSQKGDMLSQWRGYCPDGGFCLSFNKEQLNTVIKRKGMTVVQCIYDLDKQEEFIINNIIGFTPEEYLAEQVDYAERTKTTTGNFGMLWHYFTRYLPERLHRCAPVLKHPKFSEEEEWRIFKDIADYSIGPSLSEAIRHYPISKLNDINFNVTSKKNLLIPYLELEIEEEGNPITNHIANVIISPVPHKKLALESCNALLKVSECIMSADNSKIPYVNW